MIKKLSSRKPVPSARQPRRCCDRRLRRDGRHGIRCQRVDRQQHRRQLADRCRHRHRVDSVLRSRPVVQDGKRQRLGRAVEGRDAHGPVPGRQEGAGRRPRRPGIRSRTPRATTRAGSSSSARGPTRCSAHQLLPTPSVRRCRKPTPAGDHHDDADKGPAQAGPCRARGRAELRAVEVSAPRQSATAQAPMRRFRV